MIARVKGTITERGGRFIVVDVGGVGYRIYLSAPTLGKLPGQADAKVTLRTYLAVREDALDLYGFADSEEEEFFRWLIDVPGIGPKSALAILSVAPPETLKKAAGSGDSAYLVKVSGLGRKTAEKIVLALKDRVAEQKTASSREETETLEALAALGYSPKDAREALRRVPPEAQAAADKIKAVLKLLSQK